MEAVAVNPISAGWEVSGRVRAGEKTILILRNKKSRQSKRLALNDELEGWVLREIDDVHATFGNGDQTVLIALSQS